MALSLREEEFLSENVKEFSVLYDKTMEAEKGQTPIILKLLNPKTNFLYSKTNFLYSKTNFLFSKTSFLNYYYYILLSLGEKISAI